MMSADKTRKPIVRWGVKHLEKTQAPVSANPEHGGRVDHEQ